MNEKYLYTDYIRYLLAKFCMPTLLDLKPSSLVRVNKSRLDRNRLMKEIEIQIGYFDCQSAILYENKDILNLLIYNEQQLNKLISCKNVKQLFLSHRYLLHEETLTEVFNILKKRLQQFHTFGHEEGGDDFPHEIGVLLGYPLDDVEDFIKYHGKNYIFCGYWKVYHNAEEASRIFDLYRDVQQNAITLLNDRKKLKNIDKYWQIGCNNY